MKLLLTIMVIIFYQCLTQETSDIKGQLNDLASDILTIIQGLVKEIPSVKPSMDQLFRLPIQALVGLPEVSIAKILNQICSIYQASGELRSRITPKISEMAFQLETPCRNESFPLMNAETLLESVNFDVNKKLVLYVSGWKAIQEDNSAPTFAKAFSCRGGYNFLHLDASNFIDTLYTWSALNTEEIGKYVAVGLQKLVDNNFPLENIHLIGHSMGADIVGYAGRYFTKFTGKLIPHITGLEPAITCFNEGEVISGIQRGDGEFIDIIHTNPGAFGKKEPVGDVDFYAGGLAPIKPGCNMVGCSHYRAWAYYIETVYPGNERNFLAVRCSSLTKLEDGFCNGDAYAMGLDVPFSLKGNYFLDVNAYEPYGKNASESFISGNSDCGSCF